MNNYKYTEETVEKNLLKIFEEINFKYFDKNKIMEQRNNNISNVFLLKDIENSIKKINKKISNEHLKKMMYKIKILDSTNLIETNKIALDYLKNGIKIKDQKTNLTISYKLIDFKNKNNNLYKVTNQFLLSSLGSDYKKQIPDIVVYINGFPISVLELKTPRMNFSKSIQDAYEQIKNYQLNLSNLFTFNIFNCIYNGNAFKIGSLTSLIGRYNYWRHVDKNGINNQYNPLKSIFKKERLLNIIKNYVHFLDSKEKIKIFPGYHQYFDVEKAKKSVLNSFDTQNKKAGIFWHTQGSGKSYSMIFLVRNILNEKPKTTTIVITDRNDLDNQLYNTFLNSQKYLNQKVEKINSSDNLIEKLNNKKQNGIFFCTIQKFSKNSKELSNRNDILIITDEAHRSNRNIEITQYIKENEIFDKKGYAFYLRKSFPNATFIGFTGTPIETKDHQTKKIFGEYIAKYLMTDATKDEFVVPINYESRKHLMKLTKKHIDDLDKTYEKIRIKIQSQSKIPHLSMRNINKNIQKIENIILDPDRITSIAKDFVNHYRKRQNVLKGKAMFVAFNRKIAFKYYNEIVKIDPLLKENIRLIATQNNKIDTQEMKNLLKNKSYRSKSAIEFKKPDSKFKIAIVIDMWSTGFDCPSLDVLYIDKPLKMHNLMQTIARVNRVYNDKNLKDLKKDSGLIVDYIGIYKKLIDALTFYTNKQNLKKENPNWKNIEQILKNMNFFLKNIKNKWLLNLDLKIEKIIKTKNKDLIYEKVKEIQKEVYKKDDSNDQKIELFINSVKKIKKLFNACLSIVDEKTKVLVQLILHARNEIIKKELGELEIDDDIKNIKNKMVEAIKFNKTIVQSSFNNKKISLSWIINILNKKIPKSNEDKIYEKINKINAANELINRISQINKIQAEKLSSKLNKLLKKYEENIVTIEIFFEQLKILSKEGENVIIDSNSDGLSIIERSFFEILKSEEYTKDNYNLKKVKEITKELYAKTKNMLDDNWLRNEQAKSKVRKELKILLLHHNYPPNVGFNIINKISKQISENAFEIIQKEVKNE